MHIPRVYTPQALMAGNIIELEENASHHISRVLRLKITSPVIIFNGDGSEYQASIYSIENNRVNVSLENCSQPIRESNLHISLGQGISRGERMDYTLQKSVELGVKHITPLWTQRTQVKLNGRRLEKRLTHWRGVIRSACEQSGRLVLPELASPRLLETWCQDDTIDSLKLILDPEAGQKLGDLIPTGNKLHILIGPEGGLNHEEITTASAHGFTRISLGPRILRTETAAVAALCALQTLWGDLG